MYCVVARFTVVGFLLEACAFEGFFVDALLFESVDFFEFLSRKAINIGL